MASHASSPSPAGLPPGLQKADYRNAMARLGAAVCRAIFLQAGLQRHLAAPPTAMVDELDVALLHHAMAAVLPAGEVAAIGWAAGQLTGDYLLANRIPAVAQRALRLLPKSLAARILIRAIARHAWTFAGSGSFSYLPGTPLMLVLHGSPVALLRHGAHACDYYAATFQRVFAAMLGPQVTVTEQGCSAAGSPACLFAVEWRTPRRR
eukprot:gene26457-34635_t